MELFMDIVLGILVTTLFLVILAFMYVFTMLLIRNATLFIVALGVIICGTLLGIWMRYE